MTIEGNKQAVKQWFDAIERSDEQAILDLTADDFMFRAMARSPEWMKYEWDREQFAKVSMTMSELLTSPIKLDIVGMIAEGDKVAVEAETDSMMRSGKRYNNAYHFVFTLRDGKFTELREYSCSHLAQTCFGAVEPGQPEKTRMAN